MQAWTKDMLIDPVYVQTNIHPNWRALVLSSISMVRADIRRGSRYSAEYRNIIKGYQRDALAKRRKLAAARAAQIP